MPTASYSVLSSRTQRCSGRAPRSSGAAAPGYGRSGRLPGHRWPGGRRSRARPLSWPARGRSALDWHAHQPAGAGPGFRLDVSSDASGQEESSRGAGRRRPCLTAPSTRDTACHSSSSTGSAITRSAASGSASNAAACAGCSRRTTLAACRRAVVLTCCPRSSQQQCGQRREELGERAIGQPRHVVIEHTSTGPIWTRSRCLYGPPFNADLDRLPRLTASVTPTLPSSTRGGTGRALVVGACAQRGARRRCWYGDGTRRQGCRLLPRASRP